MFEIIATNNQIWLVCGGRGYYDQVTFDSAMGDLIRIRGIPSRIVHGGATGADEMAGDWARQKGIQCVAMHADWHLHGRAAGPIRNQAMLDRHKPHMVVAFPGGKGTADMVKRARDEGVDVAEIKPVEAQP